MQAAQQQFEGQNNTRKSAPSVLTAKPGAPEKAEKAALETGTESASAGIPVVAPQTETSAGGSAASAANPAVDGSRERPEAAANNEATSEEESPPESEDSFPIEDRERKQRFMAILDAIILDNFEQAVHDLEEFQAAFGGGAESLYLFGRLARRRGDLQKAYEIFKTLYYEWPLFMVDRRDFSEIRDHLLSDLLERARAQWNRIHALSMKKNAAANAFQATAETQGKPETPGTPEAKKAPGDEGSPEFLKTLEVALEVEVDKLLALYEVILRVEPHHLIALKGLVNCSLEFDRQENLQATQLRVKEAQKHWNALGAKRAKAFWTEAKRRSAEGNEEQIIQILNHGLETSPTNGPLLVFKAEILRRMGKLKEALQNLSVILREKENDGEALRLKKRILSERTAEFISRGNTYLQEAEDKIPGCGAQKQKLREALEMFFDALDIESNNLKALVGIYRAQVMGNNPVKARKTLEKIKEIEPRFQLTPNRPIDLVQRRNKGGCFVATRLYGENSREVALLRAFRETCLRPTRGGRLFIGFYERIGPALAGLRENLPAIRLLRGVVAGVVKALSERTSR